jgi:hypothetical protein
MQEKIIQLRVKLENESLRSGEDKFIHIEAKIRILPVPITMKKIED